MKTYTDLCLLLEDIEKTLDDNFEELTVEEVKALSESYHNIFVLLKERYGRDND